MCLLRARTRARQHRPCNMTIVCVCVWLFACARRRPPQLMLAGFSRTRAHGRDWITACVCRVPVCLCRFDSLLCEQQQHQRPHKRMPRNVVLIAIIPELGVCVIDGHQKAVDCRICTRSLMPPSPADAGILRNIRVHLSHRFPFTPAGSGRKHPR